MESFEFPDSILERANTITLKELLDSPISQCWIISALTNASRHHIFHPEDMTPQDEVLGFKLTKLLEQIPHEERRELFGACSAELTLRKERTQEYHARQNQQPVKVEVCAPVKK